MTVTITHPSDPIDNGATEIQSTTFANVAADYQTLTYQEIRELVSRKVKQGYVIPEFPGFKDAAPGWRFFQRTDLTGANVTDRSLIGVNIVDSYQQLTTDSTAVVGGRIAVRQGYTKLRVYVWYPVRVTRTGGEIYTVWMCAQAQLPLLIDPELGTILSNADSHNALEEAVGFLLLRAAASSPVLTPALNLYGGSLPLS